MSHESRVQLVPQTKEEKIRMIMLYPKSSLAEMVYAFGQLLEDLSLNHHLVITKGEV